jgi:hypothetical protein
MRMPIQKTDTRANWIRYRAERLIAEGKESGDAWTQAEEDWRETFKGTFVYEEYK